MASDLHFLEEIPEVKIYKSIETSRKRRVSLKSSRLQRHSHVGIATPTRQRRISSQRCMQRKRSLHHLFLYPPTINEDEIPNDRTDNLGITSVVSTSRRLSEAVAKRPTFTTVETSTGRRRSEPYLTNMFTTLIHTKRNSKASLAHGRKTYGGRRFSTAEALMMKNNRKLEALAQDELLTCLNVPLQDEPDEFLPIDENSEEIDGNSVNIDGDYIPDEENQRRIRERKKREEKRMCILQELLETEQNYISCLYIVNEVFKHPLENRNIVSQKDLKLMFPLSLNDIFNSHNSFMQDLDDRLKSNHWNVGECFQEMTSISSNLLEPYTRYVTSFPKSISTLTKYTRGSNKFRKFLDTCYHNPIVERLDLPSFLLSPVQRLPRYILLLSELHKYTEMGNPDKDLITEAKTEMEKIIFALDKSIKVSMKSYKSSESSKKIGGGGFKRHFQSTRKKKRSTGTLSSSGHEKKVGEKKSSNSNSTSSSTASPVRKSSNISNTPEITPTPLQHSPVQRRRTFDGSRENTGSLSVEMKRDRNNSWRKSLGAKLSNLFQHDRENCNGMDNNLAHLALGTSS